MYVRFTRIFGIGMNWRRTKKKETNHVINYDTHIIVFLLIENSYKFPSKKFDAKNIPKWSSGTARHVFIREK